MYKKILALLSLIVMVGCSSNPVSVEKVSTFNLNDFNTYMVAISDKSEDVKVSPFTNAGFKKEFGEQFQNLGLTEDLEKPDFKAVVSLSVEKKNKRRMGRRNPYYYDPFYDDHLYDNERSFLRLTLYDAQTGDPLWTGLRSTNYVDSELKLTPEEISKSMGITLEEYQGMQSELGANVLQSLDEVYDEFSLWFADLGNTPEAEFNDLETREQLKIAWEWYAQNHPEMLIKWLYNNQSTGRRFHLENRLFLVVSLPPIISSPILPKYSNGRSTISFVSG